VIVHQKRQREPVGKILDRLRPPPKNGAALFIKPLKMIEKISGGHPSGQPEARAVGNRPVSDHEQPAFVAPNGFVARQRRRIAHDQESGRAASRVEQQAHQEFLANRRNLYFSLEAKPTAPAKETTIRRRCESPVAKSPRP